MNICIICLEYIENDFANKKYFNCNCEHYFHNKCIECWMSKTRTCPMCRMVLNDDILYTPRRLGCLCVIIFSFCITLFIIIKGITSEMG